MGPVLLRRFVRLAVIPGMPLLSVSLGSAMVIVVVIVVAFFRVVLEVVARDERSEDEFGKGLAHAVGSASIDGTMLPHDGHLVLLAVHSAGQLVHEHLYCCVSSKLISWHASSS